MNLNDAIEAALNQREFHVRGMRGSWSYGRFHVSSHSAVIATYDPPLNAWEFGHECDTPVQALPHYHALRAAIIGAPPPGPEQLTMNTPTTTFARIKAAGPCEARYKLALRKAGGLRKYGENTPITVRQIVEAVGLDDALWCLRTMPEHNARWRLLAVRYARRVQHLMTDPRSVAVLDVAERHAHGSATDTELDAARAAAWVAWAAGDAAGGAAWDAAWAAARDAAWDAAWVAWAAGDAARAAAWAAEWAAEREWQAAELIRICDE